MFIGKRVGGKRSLLPDIFAFGGFLFINFWDWSLMIPLPNWLIEKAARWGIDLIGD